MGTQGRKARAIAAGLVVLACGLARAEGFDLARIAPGAVRWAEAQSAQALARGVALSPEQRALARQVGVREPERVRLVVVEAMPLPEEPVVAAAAARIGLGGDAIVGMTLGHAVLIRRGYEGDRRLLSHELRHVAQYEAQGGIAPFLARHLEDLARYGYAESPFERDARAHEVKSR